MSDDCFALESSKSTKVDHFEEAMKLAVGSGDNKYKNGAIPNGNAKITGKDGQKGDRLTQEQREEQKAAAKEAHRKVLLILSLSAWGCWITQTFLGVGASERRAERMEEA